MRAKPMARQDNKKRGEAPPTGKWSEEVTGIVLLAVGLLLLLSLVSYSPADLPRVGFLEAFADKTGERGGNLMGPVGAVLGFSTPERSVDSERVKRSSSAASADVSLWKSRLFQGLRIGIRRSRSGEARYPRLTA